MGDVGELFTDRTAALQAANALVTPGGAGRVLVLTGVSGMGKSTVLARLTARPPGGWACAAVDAEALVSGMAVPAEGSEEAALALLRAVGGHLAAVAPWWRRRWLRKRAAAIGGVRPRTVTVRQWAGFGGSISGSPVQVAAGVLTQGERRGQWIGELLTVARAVRRRRLLLMADTSELLAYFDDVSAEQPRPNRPYGVAGWFSGVVDQLLEQMPHLRVIIAGTTTPAMPLDGKDTRGRVVRLELEAWDAKDTGAYLARRGLAVKGELAEAVTGACGGLPVEISWIIDILTGHLADGHGPEHDSRDPAAELSELIIELTAQARPAREAWLRGHVLQRITGGTLRLLQAAAVLEVFTPAALLTVARSSMPDRTLDENAFARLERSSSLRVLDGGAGRWRIHGVLRGWLLDAARNHDAQQPSAARILPALHQAAADYYEALADGQWSLPAARHRFATGDDRHSPQWTTRLTHALAASPIDTLQVQALTDAALTDPDPADTLAAVRADAHLARALLDFHHADHPVAQQHAEQALALYQRLGAPAATVRIAARLAGHAAWNRPRFQDAATHWATALSPQARSSNDQPEICTGQEQETDKSAEHHALHRALTWSVLNTGDAPHAHRLLAALPDTPPAPRPGQVDTDDPSKVTSPATAVTRILTSNPLPGARPGDTLLLRARSAYRLNDYETATTYAKDLLEQQAGPHHTALAHEILASIAILAWDIEQATQHTGQGITAARRCPDRNCLIHLLLTDANLAWHRANWTSPDNGPRPPAAPRLNAPAAATPATSLSLTQRAESAHQRKLADRQLRAAQTLATELNDPHLQAHALADHDPAKAFGLYRTIGDRHGEANTLATLANTARQTSDVNRAREYAEPALTLYRTLGNRHGEASTLATLAETARQTSDVNRAREYAEPALTLYRTLGIRLGEASTLATLAETARQTGDVNRAREYAEPALTLYRTLGIRYGEASTLATLADTARQTGDVNRAREYAEPALTLYRTLGIRLGEANTLATLAETARQTGDVNRAREYAEPALTLYRTLGIRLGEASTLATLADTARQTGDVNRAREYAEPALTLYRTLGDRLGEANTLATLAETARQTGDVNLAREYAEPALTLYRTLGKGLGEANTLRTLAKTARQAGDIEAGRRTMGEAISLFTQIGLGRYAALCRQELVF